MNSIAGMHAVREALRSGAAYVYGDRLESKSEADAFKTLLDAELNTLSLANPRHGKDPAKRLISG